ncbi:MAG TPA: peptidoglycan-binding domain-containing protein [Ilumatobacter sp.]|nr:peptidoglycan-binding domain-containing protein [Ilumatobacter sp.]
MDDTDLELNGPTREPDHHGGPPWSRTHVDDSEEVDTEPSEPGPDDPVDDADPTPVGGVGAVPVPEAVVDDPLVRPTELAPTEPEIDLAAYPGLSGADGRRRRRTALAVLIAAVAAGGAGMYVGTRIESPADRAAARSAPIPSLITVPVERRPLASEIVLNGEVAYNEPVTVKLAGGVGIAPGDSAVVTETRPAGTALNEGDLLVEVTGRPVFVLRGDLPMYRRMAVGSEGPDVVQLEEALVRLGYTVDSVDTVFDASTAAAVEQMYIDSGYTAEGPSAEQQGDLVAAREAVTGAERGLADARAALAEADNPLPESQRLQLQQAVNDAREAVPLAQTAAQTTRTEHEQFVASARAARDTARTQRDAAVTVRDHARSPGAIDPDTGEPYTAERIAALDVAAAEAQETYTAAEGQLVIAEQTRTTAVAAADRAIGDAQAQLQIAEAQYREATAGADTSALRDAVTSAERALTATQADLLALEAAAGTRISPGELVFVPVLPSTLTESYVTLGSGIEGPLGLLATTDTLVRARVARADAALVAVGARVAVEIRDAGINTTGTVLSIGEPNVPGGEQPGVGGPAGGGTSGRMEVVVAPADDVDLGRYMWYGVRVRVQIDATDGDVLVVPVAALTVGPDQVSQVEVEREPATADRPAVTEVVAVAVGLSANGLAEVSPVEPGALEVGDRVVIGVDTNTLPGNADGGDGGTPGGTPEPGDPGGSPTDGDGGDDDGDGDGVTSPLAELMGWVTDPVEQRRQNLAIEEAIVTCMTAEGWEYTAVDWQAQIPDQDQNWGSPEFGAKYGYGVMYQYELYELGEGDGGMFFDDPNQEYVESLTDSEREAYYASLSGDPSIWQREPEFDENGEEIWVNPPLDQMGCQGKARLEVVGDDPMSDPAVQEALNEYYESQYDNAELDQMTRAWQDCFRPKLAEYGIDTVPETVGDGYQLMDVEKYKAMGAEVIPVANQAEADEYFNSGENVLSAWTDETGAGYVVLSPGEPGEELPDLTGEQIDELTAMEVDLWKADQTCQEEIGYADYHLRKERELVEQLLSRFPELGG